MSDSITALEQQINALTAQLVAAKQAPPPAAGLKLDLGCGKFKREGFTGVDSIAFPGVDVVADLAGAPWPWADGSVEEVHCSHMLEHVPREKRVHFFNELYRVLRPGGKAQFVTPHWASERAFGDITHEWPPVVPMFWGYLNKAWRDQNAPHCGFACDFDAVPVVQTAPVPFLQGRNQEFLAAAVAHGINTGFDMHCTLTRK